jgi:hypothetical protein
MARGNHPRNGVAVLGFAALSALLERCKTSPMNLCYRAHPDLFACGLLLCSFFQACSDDAPPTPSNVGSAGAAGIEALAGTAGTAELPQARAAAGEGGNANAGGSGGAGEGGVPAQGGSAKEVTCAAPIASGCPGDLHLLTGQRADLEHQCVSSTMTPIVCGAIAEQLNSCVADAATGDIYGVSVIPPCYPDGKWRPCTASEEGSLDAIVNKCN